MSTELNGDSSDSPHGGIMQLDDHEHENQDNDRSFTARALLAGLFLGVLVNLSNTYYGLRVGAGSQMSMVSGLLGFIGFKLFSKRTTIPFTAAENVLIIKENGPLELKWGSLVMWSIGLCLFGLFFASMLREHFVVRENLPWPGPKANAHLINTLHQRSVISAALSGESPVPRVLQQRVRRNGRLQPSVYDPLLPRGDDLEWKLRVNGLFRGATISGVIVVLMYFVPILHAVPVFGFQAATHWFWTLDMSPGFFGQGMITGPIIPLHMILGTIVGWGILSPYAKYRGWAPGKVDDWETGSRGWIIWVSLAALLADGSVKLSRFLV
ncbi:hypothetical protein IFR05_004443 [Cadophora sp. M221]|nr:hypothetical protein IFR05_004443 [Cadophora sp. M221]